MRKNYCSMTLNVRRDVKSSFRLAICGNVKGYESDGSPAPGDFMVLLDSDGSDTFFVNLPRQLDESLLLEVDTGGKVVKKFPLGRYILESGYDWNAPDLEDMTVYMDYAHSRITISVEQWDKEYIFDITV